MTILEFPKRIARWRQIADSVGRDLRSACFVDGRLPTEEALARRFGVNRHTIHRAIAPLAEQGLVRVELGRGTFVCGDRAAPQHRSRHTVSAESEGDEFRRRLIRARQSPSNTRTAKDFGIAAGVAVIEIDTLAELDGTPMSFESHRFRA
jgi:GntR family transcriptional regulator, phosphonate transport system regulatory protein